MPVLCWNISELQDVASFRQEEGLGRSIWPRPGRVTSRRLERQDCVALQCSTAVTQHRANRLGLPWNVLWTCCSVILTHSQITSGSDNSLAEGFLHPSIGPGACTCHPFYVMSRRRACKLSPVQRAPSKTHPTSWTDIARSDRSASLVHNLKPRSSGPRQQHVTARKHVS